MLGRALPRIPLPRRAVAAHSAGRTQAVAESTFTVAVTEIKPSRHAVHGVYSIEDDARLPGMADAIERDMRASIVQSVDLACFKGDSGANENSADVTGMQTASISEFTITQANKIKPAETLEEFVALVDGIYAAMNSDLRIVASVGANKLWYGTIANSTASNDTMARFLMENGLTWMARGDIETNTANGDFGAYVGLANGIEGSAIAAVWSRPGSWSETPTAGQRLARFN